MASSVLSARARVTDDPKESNWRSTHTGDNADNGNKTPSIRDEPNIIRVKTFDELKASVENYGNVNVEVDVFKYDVSAEARSRARFRLGQFIESFLTDLFQPVSFLYIYWMYGWAGLQYRSYAPPSSSGSNDRNKVVPLPENDINTNNKADSDVEKADSTFDIYAGNADNVQEGVIKDGDGQEQEDEKVDARFYDPEKPPYQPTAYEFYIVNNVFSTIRLVWFATSLSAGLFDLNDGQSRAPLYAFCSALLLVLLFLASLSMKKAFRTEAEAPRLQLHRERRCEELLFGWLPLPWRLVVWELRIAARRMNIDLVQENFAFNTCSVTELQAALGPKVCSYMEGGLGTDTVKPYVYSLPDGTEKTGAQCSALALLTRICLSSSHASPPFEDDAKGMYLDDNSSPLWSRAVNLLQALPFIAAHGIQEGGTYSPLAIVSVILSTLLIFFVADGPPQGWTMGAILTFRRKTAMLNELNSLLLINRDEMDLKDERELIDLSDGKQSLVWPYAMDLTNTHNIDIWRKCREVFVEFGQKYKARTDANGAIMIAYIGIFTLVILVGTVISPIQWEFTDICFVVIMQIYLLFLMGGFAVALAFEGDRHTEVGERSQVILAAMAIQLEKERWMHAKSITREKEYAYESARFSISQLQASITSSMALNPTEVLDIISLNKGMAISVLFALVTQITLILENVNTGSG